MSEVNDEVNTKEVDNSSSQVLEIMPPRNNDKVEGVDLVADESGEKPSEYQNEITLEKVSSVSLIHGNHVQQDLLNNTSKPGTSSSPESNKKFKCCPEGFCELVARRKHRTDKLIERQAEISSRLATLETWLPMVTLNKIIKCDCDPRNVIKYIEEQAKVMSSVTKQSVLRQQTGEIGGRKEALRRHEEARTVLHEKQLQLKKLNEQIEAARRRQEELQVKIYDVQNLKDNQEIKQSESEYSFGPEDLENLSRLENLIVGEEKLKKDLKELERKERAYVEMLKSSEFWKTKKDFSEGNDEVDKLRGQLAAKNSANQQLADRICQLEDQIENLESKLRNCNHRIIEFSERRMEGDGKMKTTNGDSEISLRDKATLARVITTDRSSGTKKKRSSFEGKTLREKEVNAIVDTSSKSTNTRTQVTDRAVQDPIPSLQDSNEKSIGNKKMSIQKIHSYSSYTSGKSSKENEEETVQRITTFDKVQTSGKTLLSPDNESSSGGGDTSRDDQTSRDDYRQQEMGKHSENEKLEGNPESLLDSKSAAENLLTIPEFEDHKDSYDQSTQYEIDLPFPGVDSINNRPDQSSPKSFVSMKSKLSKEETTYDVSGIPDDQSKHSSVKFANDKTSSDKETNYISSDRRDETEKSFVSLKSQLSKEETDYDISGVEDRSRNQSKHSSVRFEEKSSGEKSFKSMKSQLSRELTNYEFSDTEEKIPEAPGNNEQSSKLFVSLKSRLSKEETDYGEVCVERGELESWLKNLEDTDLVISRCKECYIKKPQVIEIIEAIRQRLGIGLTKTHLNQNQIQIQDTISDERRSVIKKGSKPVNLELKENEEMKMIKDDWLPEGTSTPIDKEFHQPTELYNNDIDQLRSIRGSYREQARSESINSRSIGFEVNTFGGSPVLTHLEIPGVSKPDIKDKPSKDDDFKRRIDTITTTTMDKVDGDVGGVVTLPLVDESSQSHKPDAPLLLLNENPQQQKHQNRDETNNSGAASASIVLPSTLGITPNPRGITNTATASTSTSYLSRRGEGNTPTSKGNSLTAYSYPQGEILQNVTTKTKMNSTESTRGISMRRRDVEFRGKFDEKERDKMKKDHSEIGEGQMRKGKSYGNKEFDGLSDTDGDRKKVKDKLPITVAQTRDADRRLSSGYLPTCCICHQAGQGKKLTMSQVEELVAGAGPTVVCLRESTSEFSDQQTVPSHKTKPSKSSRRKAEAGTSTRTKDYPDFSCDPCDCNPCGTGKSLGEDRSRSRKR